MDNRKPMWAGVNAASSLFAKAGLDSSDESSDEERTPAVKAVPSGDVVESSRDASLSPTSVSKKQVKSLSAYKSVRPPSRKSLEESPKHAKEGSSSSLNASSVPPGPFENTTVVDNPSPPLPNPSLPSDAAAPRATASSTPSPPVVPPSVPADDGAPLSDSGLASAPKAAAPALETSTVAVAPTADALAEPPLAPVAPAVTVMAAADEQAISVAPAVAAPAITAASAASVVPTAGGSPVSVTPTVAALAVAVDTPLTPALATVPVATSNAAPAVAATVPPVASVPPSPAPAPTPAGVASPAVAPPSDGKSVKVKAPPPGRAPAPAPPPAPVGGVGDGKSPVPPAKPKPAQKTIDPSTISLSLLQGRERELSHREDQQRKQIAALDAELSSLLAQSVVVAPQAAPVGPSSPVGIPSRLKSSSPSRQRGQSGAEREERATAKAAAERAAVEASRAAAAAAAQEAIISAQKVEVITEISALRDTIRAKEAEASSDADSRAEVFRKLEAALVSIALRQSTLFDDAQRAYHAHLTTMEGIMQARQGLEASLASLQRQSSLVGRQAGASAHNWLKGGAAKTIGRSLRGLPVSQPDPDVAAAYTQQLTAELQAKAMEIQRLQALIGEE